jgi:hypothetical protein
LQTMFRRHQRPAEGVRFRSFRDELSLDVNRSDCGQHT